MVEQYYGKLLAVSIFAACDQAATIAMPSHPSLAILNFCGTLYRNATVSRREKLSNGVPDLNHNLRYATL